MSKQIIFTASLLLVGGSAFACPGNNASADNAVGVATDAIILAQNTTEEPSETEKSKRSKEVESDAEKAAEKAEANANLPEKSDKTDSAALPEGEDDDTGADDEGTGE